MLTFVIETVKKLIGLPVRDGQAISRKRAASSVDFSSDEEDEDFYSNSSSVKRRRISAKDKDGCSHLCINSQEAMAERYLYLPTIVCHEDSGCLDYPKTFGLSSNTSERFVRTKQLRDYTDSTGGIHTTTERSTWPRYKNGSNTLMQPSISNRTCNNSDTKKSKFREPLVPRFIDNGSHHNHSTQKTYAIHDTSTIYHKNSEDKEETQTSSAMRKKMCNTLQPKLNKYTPIYEKLFRPHSPISGCNFTNKRWHISRRLTAYEMIRLEEKECYQKLLQQLPVSLPLRMTGARNLLSFKRNVAALIKNQPVKYAESASPKLKALVKEKLRDSDQKEYIHRISISSTVRKPLPGHMSRMGNSSLVVESKSVKSEQSGAYSPVKANIEPITIDSDFSDSENSTIPKISRTPTSWKASPKYDHTEIPYSPEWLRKWKSDVKIANLETQRCIETAELTAKILKDNFDHHNGSLVTRLRTRLTLSELQPEVVEEVFLKDVEDEEIEQFPEITPEMEELIDEALNPNPPGEVLAEAFRLQIRRRDMETLAGLNWLNDEIINFYMNMLMERGKLENYPSVYACNTFFYPKLIAGGHSALKRWTRKIDVFAHDIMLVPVHLGVHWCLSVVHFKDKTMKYYDSMGGTNNECLNALKEYIQAESLDKKNTTFDISDWIIQNVKNIPQQMNSCDCGMFACKYAEYITRNAKITFKQDDMLYFRQRMVYEILMQTLL